VFIAIEGGEGAGKGSIQADLSARLTAQGLQVLPTREPGGTPEGLELRRLLLGSEGRVWDPWSELLLMTAARVQHVRRVILPAVERGDIVISDRFVGSTIAYQGAGQGIAAADIEALHRQAVGDVWPDLTIVLDIDPRIGIARSLARLGQQDLDEGRFEAMSLEFHDRIRASFLQQAAARPGSHVVIDAGAPMAEVASRVFEAVSNWHGVQRQASSSFSEEKEPKRLL
jgi:dTMP kinase